MLILVKNETMWLYKHKQPKIICPPHNSFVKCLVILSADYRWIDDRQMLGRQRIDRLRTGTSICCTTLHLSIELMVSIFSFFPWVWLIPVVYFLLLSWCIFLSCPRGFLFTQIHKHLQSFQTSLFILHFIFNLYTHKKKSLWHFFSYIWYIAF